jgi:hypothetical protein
MTYKKNLLFALWITSLMSCKNDNLTPDKADNVVVLVQPLQTDGNYSSADKNHYVVRNNKTHLNKLLLFIGGSYSNPPDYHFVSDHGATIGLDVINLSYPNDVATAPLGTSSDKFIFDNYREELCFGAQVSNEVSVDVLNCITTRTIKLLQYLSKTYPDQNWGQYLTTTNTLQWSKIIVSGHSQGSGHACFLGKKNLVDRVVMFAGPNDYSTFFSAPANWLTISGQTSLTKYFSLLHTQDEIVPFSNQVANLRGLGLLTAGQNPTLVDNLTTPYSNAHSLSLNIPAISNHASPIGGNAKLPSIWTYMFTTQ